MYICYIDEAGCLGKLPSDCKETQPVFTINGIFIKQESLRDLTIDFLDIKTKFFPDKDESGKALSRLYQILPEIKGSDLRKAWVKKNKKRLLHNRDFIKAVLKMLIKYDAKIVGRVFIKKPDRETTPAGIYNSSIQIICSAFQQFLQEKDAKGIVIVDGRDFNQNVKASHSIFTQMFKYSGGGDSYSRIVDMPTFGHSNNHSGIQIADLICSALIFPIAVRTYCFEKIDNIHVKGKYLDIKNEFSGYLYNMQYRYVDHDGNHKGGIFTSDPLGKQSGKLLFSNIKDEKQSNTPARSSQLKALKDKFNN
jgi:hypothetical protein